MEFSAIESSLGNPPLGHYSQAVRCGHLLFLSNQLGLVIDDSNRLPDSIEEETRNALNSVREILAEAGSCITNIVKVQIYVSTIDLWATVDQVYASFLKSHKPARTVLPCGELHHGARVGFDVIATI